MEGMRPFILAVWNFVIMREFLEQREQGGYNAESVGEQIAKGKMLGSNPAMPAFRKNDSRAKKSPKECGLLVLRQWRDKADRGVR